MSISKLFDTLISKIIEINKILIIIISCSLWANDDIYI